MKEILKRYGLLLLILTTIQLSALAQKGKIRGTVYEDATGETLIGVTVYLKGTSTGAVTDFDGKFEISADAGTYDVLISFVSYETITISGVVVEEGEVALLENIRLREAVSELEEVIVTAEVIRDSESALLTVKKKSANLLDGISSAKFKKIGDSDAASAVKRVTGVSIEGDKYVYVRGLGDRYTKTTLNNVDVPGLDPDRNSIQIDIFPTNLIQNMIVSKTALAEMPADFTGGAVNIETKDFPEERILDVSLGLTFNPSMHFNSDYISYDGSDTDWLGYNSGLRDLPAGARGEIPEPAVAQDEEVFAFSKDFSPILQNTTQSSFMNYSLGLTFGDQKRFDNSNTLGFILTGTYRDETTYFSDASFGEAQIPDQSDPDNELIIATDKQGVIGTRNILTGGLAGIAFKTRNSKYKLNAMHLQNGESKSGRFFVIEDPEDGRDAVGKSNYIAPNAQNLEYSQRSISNFLLNGEHHIAEDRWVIDWRVSPTISKIEDPDIRSAAFTQEFGLSFNAGAAGLPTRIWRYLDETNLVGRLDFENNTSLFGRDARIKFGSSYTFKERDYEILEYQLAFFGRQPEWTENDLNLVLVDDNLFPNSGNAYYQSGVLDPNPNEYNSSLRNIGFYVSAEVNPTDKLKAIVGLRAEDFEQKHTGRDRIAAQTIQSALRRGEELSSVISRIQEDPNLGRVLDDEKVLDALDFFPSLNTTYAINDEQNLRFSYARTIARPSFKEVSFAQILDPVSGRTFNGGLFPYDTDDDQWDGNIRETYINNFDLRWEIFLQEGQTYSISAFYKSFQNPIELVRIPAAQTTNELQVRNVGDSYVYGAEFEFRTALSRISTALDNFFFNGNITVTQSVLEMTNVEFVGRQAFEREGQTVENTRTMAGQAPYVINGGFSYENNELGLNAGLYYNVQGRTLSVVGVRLFPDVFTEPFHSLNFSLNKSFGERQNFTTSLNIENILNDRREEFFVGYEAQDQIFTGFSPGTSIGISAGYKF
jgi:outer membrane receptor protein involved in Fe transport